MIKEQLPTSKESSFQGCWVAKVVIPDKWLDAREYMAEESPQWLRTFYLKYGEKIAGLAQKSRFLRMILKPLFLYFAYRGSLISSRD